jgi:hypothetical protein
VAVEKGTKAVIPATFSACGERTFNSNYRTPTFRVMQKKSRPTIERIGISVQRESLLGNSPLMAIG